MLTLPDNPRTVFRRYAKGAEIVALFPDVGGPFGTWAMLSSLEAKPRFAYGAGIIAETWRAKREEAAKLSARIAKNLGCKTRAIKAKSVRPIGYPVEFRATVVGNVVIGVLLNRWANDEWPYVWTMTLEEGWRIMPLERLRSREPSQEDRSVLTTVANYELVRRAIISTPLPHRKYPPMTAEMMCPAQPVYKRRGYFGVLTECAFPNLYGLSPGPGNANRCHGDLSRGATFGKHLRSGKKLQTYYSAAWGRKRENPPKTITV